MLSLLRCCSFVTCVCFLFLLLSLSSSSSLTRLLEKSCACVCAFARVRGILCPTPSLGDRACAGK
jgi:hypothetical protein